MSILLKPVGRRKPGDKQAETKFYAIQYTTKLVEEAEVAELLAEETTLNPMEAMMAIRQLRKVVERQLLDGKSVRLGNWGTFSITLNSEGAPSREELTTLNIKRVNIMFRPSEDLKAAMQKAEFVWLDKAMENKKKDEGEATD